MLKFSDRLGGEVMSLDELCDWFRGLDSVLVAFSGGVDSSVLAAVAFHVLKGQAVAATVKSELQSEDDLTNAVTIAKEIGIEHKVLDFQALDVEDIRENRPLRCYLCKRAMAERLTEEAKRQSIAVVVDGTNASDKEEDRPGMKALFEFEIRMPLRELGITKSGVRELARVLGLSNSDRPSRSCLATRIEGSLDPERLDRVEMAEKHLPKGWRIVDFGEQVLVKVPEGEVLGQDLIAKLKSLGYREVDREPG